jgi:aspartyl-tRNA(Asn)/glutamyl-tRNA(Gln) amidotransferase subunit B
MSNFITTIGLEIHVQLKTKSKMFCRCDNNAEGKAPNTVVCPVCLGLPGALPVANKQAILWTIKTGLALNARIPQIAKFDRKHYFYPDLPKGYQISQYDEPFCLGGYLEVNGHRVNFNRIHLEEDAGKLIHTDGESLIDLNRAGTPLMEIVTEPDLTSPKMAGDFLRRLQKLVRDEVEVSEADMEKGHLRCDANISVTDSNRMSEIVEIKNLNSFKFVEKALEIEELRLKDEYPNWPEEKTKVTRGYDSKKNETFSQRIKEEAADYRYFPEPDLPPFDTTKFDFESLKNNLGQSEDQLIAELISEGVREDDACILAIDKKKKEFFDLMKNNISEESSGTLAKAIVHHYLSYFSADENTIKELGKAIDELAQNKISKQIFSSVADVIREGKTYEDSKQKYQENEIDLQDVINKIIRENPVEAAHFKAGKKQLLGFFIGLAMKETAGRADPKKVRGTLEKTLESYAPGA